MQAAHRYCRPRSDVAIDQPSGRPPPGAGAVAPQRAQFGSVAMFRAWQPSARLGAPCDRELVRALLDEAGATRNRDVLADILRTAYDLACDDADRLDLKITRDALSEMRDGLPPVRPVPRRAEGDGLRIGPHAQHRPALRSTPATWRPSWPKPDWMVVTGAGPGIMAAATEGAGPERSLGVTIRLPFEETTTGPLSGSDRVVSMKYFFTRKLMLMKESSGFVSLPGGFGTLDETFELLTLMQTGKATPAPIVLLDVPGRRTGRAGRPSCGTSWSGPAGSRPTTSTCTRSPTTSTRPSTAIRGFLRNYQRLRWVGDRLVIRLRAAPTDAEVAELSEEFADLADGPIERTRPLPPEVADDDHLELPRLVLAFDVRKGGRFRELIRAINALDTAPPL